MLSTQKPALYAFVFLGHSSKPIPLSELFYLLFLGVQAQQIPNQTGWVTFDLVLSALCLCTGQALTISPKHLFSFNPADNIFFLMTENSYYKTDD